MLYQPQAAGHLPLKEASILRVLAISSKAQQAMQERWF